VGGGAVFLAARRPFFNNEAKVRRLRATRRTIGVRMSTESLTPRRNVRLLSPIVTSPLGQRIGGSWFYRFLVFPIGQMLLFIIAATVLLTTLSYLLAAAVPEPRPGIVLADQISRQLPGMIISGISIGFVYAMIALGYTLVYGVLKFINFAHSEIFMVGSVVGFEVMRRIYESGTLGDWNPILLIVAVIVAAMLISGLLAVSIERVAYRPLRGAPRLVPLITAIGISFVLQDSVRAFEALTRNDFNLTYPTNQISWLSQPVPLAFNGAVVGGINIGGTTYDEIIIDGTAYDEFGLGSNTYDSIVLGGVSFGGIPVRARDVSIGETEFETIMIGGRDLGEITSAANVVNIRVTSIIVVVGAVIMLVGLNYFVNGTKVGRGIRAVSQDQTTAGLMGINVNRMIAITFFVGGALGGAAGALFGMNVGTVTPYVGFIPGIKAFTAAVLGGIGNVSGALLGGLTLGIIEAFLNGILVYFPALGQRYTDIFAFSVLILILVFRPSGLLGERVDEKV
jgi:branched-subunit amino acid ABC-type transport system permease component